KKLDAVRARTIDAKNPVRLIRALEIVKTTGKPVPQNYHSKRYSVVSGNTVLQIGIKKSPKELKGLISKRLNKRIIGMIAEVKKIHAGGLSYKRLEELGLEYRFAAQYVQGKITKEEMVKILEKEIWQYAKRQMTWFKRDKKIHWIATQKEAATLAKKFLGQ
ncbi:MAG TPA: tRNA dimethylallyltransferase, partial [Negativicutes bacterium]|nr:tRNA dimethylallyltransferase [Negativicutes bacterium]